MEAHRTKEGDDLHVGSAGLVRSRQRTVMENRPPPPKLEQHQTTGLVIAVSVMQRLGYSYL